VIAAEEFTRIKGRHFQDRIALVKSLVASGPYSDEKRQVFEKFFARLDPIRELRNQIAHGHLLSRWLEDAKTWQISLVLPKDLDAPTAPETRHLDSAELTEALTELTELIEEFQKLSGHWIEEKVEIHANGG